MYYGYTKRNECHETFAAIREKREAKGKNKNRHQELKAEVQRKLRVDKQQQLESTCVELEAGNSNNCSCFPCKQDPSANHERIRVKTETEIADEQAGFRQGRGTRDQITNFRILMHKAHEHQQPHTCMCFVEFKKSFDSISHDNLWGLMDMGYPLHLIDSLAKLYRKQLANLKVAQGHSHTQTGSDSSVNRSPQEITGRAIASLRYEMRPPPRIWPSGKSHKWLTPRLYVRKDKIPGLSQTDCLTGQGSEGNRGQCAACQSARWMHRARNGQGLLALRTDPRVCA